MSEKFSARMHQSPSDPCRTSVRTKNPPWTENKCTMFMHFIESVAFPFNCAFTKGVGFWREKVFTTNPLHILMAQAFLKSAWATSEDSSFIWSKYFWIEICKKWKLNILMEKFHPHVMYFLVCAATEATKTSFTLTASTSSHQIPFSTVSCRVNGIKRF